MAIQRGLGKVEFISMQSSIKKSKEAGYTLKSIYARLYEHGKITLSFRQFTRYYKQFCKASEVPQKENSLSESVTLSEPHVSPQVQNVDLNQNHSKITRHDLESVDLSNFQIDTQFNERFIHKN